MLKPNYRQFSEPILNRASGLPRAGVWIAVRCNKSLDPSGDFRGAVSAVYQTLVETAVAYRPTCDRCRGNAALGGVGFNSLNKCVSVHVALRDICPAYVKGLLSSFAEKRFGL